MARNLHGKGVAATDIAKVLALSRATVYRYLGEKVSAWRDLSVEVGSTVRASPRTVVRKHVVEGPVDGRWLTATGPLSCGEILRWLSTKGGGLRTHPEAVSSARPVDLVCSGVVDDDCGDLTLGSVDRSLAREGAVFLDVRILAAVTADV